MNRSFVNTALALLFLSSIPPVFAQPAAQVGAPPAGEKAAPAAPEKNPSADYDKAVGAMSKIAGPLTLYIKNGKEIFLEIPEQDLGRIFYVQSCVENGVMGGGLQAGFPIDDQPVMPYQWERVGDEHINLVRPRTKYRNNPEDLATAIDRSFPDAILSTFKIEQKDPDKKRMLINVTEFFSGKLEELNEMVKYLVGANGKVQYALDPVNKKISAQAFPENSVVHTELHYTKTGGTRPDTEGRTALTVEDDRSIPIKLVYNVWYPKKSDYVARLFDVRIGYFTQDFYDFERFYKRDREEQYIRRWNLKKKNPNAAMSEPVKPIVWVLDSSIPQKYRPGVRDGILMWNKAFEKLGYQNAVQVKDCEDIPDYNFADGRFNVLRWVISPDSGYAVALFRTDPFTGEILNANINFDFNFLAHLRRQHETVEETINGQEPDYLLQKFLEDPRAASELLNTTPQQRAMKSYRESLKKMGRECHECEYAEGLARNAPSDWEMLTDLKLFTVPEEEYVRKTLASVICHEVGHCLGLRHNFAASGSISSSQLADPAYTREHGIGSSVMDYTPLNVFGLLKGQRNYITETVGKYDEWAIQYGYTEFNESTPQGARKQLSEIAKDSGDPEHRYMTDGDVASDPSAIRFDLASDQVAYWGAQMIYYDKMIDFAVRRMPVKGGMYERRTSKVLSGVMGKFRTCETALNILGGIKRNRSFYGDIKAPLPLIPYSADEQREVISMVASNLFKEDPFGVPPNLYQTLGRNPERGDQAPVNVLGMINMMQVGIMTELLDTGVVKAVRQSSFLAAKSGESRYDLPMHYGLVLGKIFSDVGQNKPISPTRRDLQTYTLRTLIKHAGIGETVGQPVECRLIIENCLQRLKGRYLKQLKKPKGLDSGTVLYMKDSCRQIDQYFNRARTQEMFLPEPKKTN